MLNGTFADDGSLVHMNEEMEVVDAIHCISDNVSAVTLDLLQIPRVRVRPQYMLSVSENNIFSRLKSFFYPPTKAQ